MKLIRFGKIALLATVAMLTGCLERTFVEEVGVVSVNTRELVVPADLFEGRNLVKDTLYVTSNRSWSVTFENDVDWVAADTTGNLNMSRVSSVNPIVFSFADNDGAERSVRAHITCADGDKWVTIRQEAMVPRLVLTSSTDGFGSVSSDGETLALAINSNTSWSVAVKTGATSVVTFPVSSGKYTDSIKVKVAENEELLTKNATVVISAAGCKDIEVPITQLQGIPYLRFRTAEGVTTIDHDPGVSNYKIPIKTNSAWTAELISVEGYPAGDVKVTPSGTKGEVDVDLEFPYCIDFDHNGKVVVRFRAEGVPDPVDFTLNQTAAIRLQWYDFVNKKLLGGSQSTSPVATPIVSEIPTSAGNALAKYKGAEFDFVLTNGFVFSAYSTAGLWRNSGTGLMFGQATNDYLKLPAVPGKKLVKMFYAWGISRTASTNHALQLRDPSGADVESTPAIAFAGDTTNISGQDHHQENTFVFTGTKPGVQYTLWNTAGKNFGIGDLILYYE